MKSKIDSATQGAAGYRPTRQPTPKRSLLARIWDEVHPRPPRPIDHPIPPLTPSPVPPAGEVRAAKGEGLRTGRECEIPARRAQAAGQAEGSLGRAKIQASRGRSASRRGGLRARGKSAARSGARALPGETRPAALDLLSRVLAAWIAVTLLGAGCAGPRPLRGGKAVLTRTPGGVVEQTVVQGQNAAETSHQDQESVKVRTYTVPAGSRVEQCPDPYMEAFQSGRSTGTSEPRVAFNQPSSSAFVLSAPMPVVEREETRARAQLGAAQKDMARELGARLSSLKGIVWVGAGLFVCGLASLVWPPLKALIGSVTTSAALMLGGVALVVLPSLVVGNELLILGMVALAVGAWFLAHRHGHLRGMLATGLRDCETTGPRDNKTTRPQDYETTGCEVKNRKQKSVE